MRTLICYQCQAGECDNCIELDTKDHSDICICECNGDFAQLNPEEQEYDNFMDDEDLYE